MPVDQQQIAHPRYDHRSFFAMGTTINLWIDHGSGAAGRMAFNAAVTFIERFDRELSRFSDSSELTRLNDDPREAVPASSLMVRFVETALWAAHFSGGLIDPTVIDELETIGYRESLTGRDRAPLATALADAPARACASADPRSRWTRISVDAERSLVLRPAGVRLDSGGCGKGLAADMVAALWRGLLPEGTGWIVDCGGDMKLSDEPAGGGHEITLINPLSPESPIALTVNGGAVATSGVGSRVWVNGDGSYAHHLIDPATGRPAWTGLVSATALAPSTVEAEALAKLVLLRGPGAAEELLGIHGGLVQHDDGTVALFGPLLGGQDEIEITDGKEAA